MVHFYLPSYATIYRELERTILAANTQEDLKWFSNNHGPEMHMNWPAFEVLCQDSKTTMKIVYRSILLSLPSGIQSRSIRLLLLQRKRNQMEPHPLQAQTMWRHLVTAAGSINKSVVYKTHISTSNVCFVCLFRFYSGLLPSILYRFFYSVNTLQHFTLEFTSISFVSSLHAV